MRRPFRSGEPPCPGIRSLFRNDVNHIRTGTIRRVDQLSNRIHTDKVARHRYAARLRLKKGCLMNGMAIFVQPRNLLTHLNFGAYHLRLAFYLTGGSGEPRDLEVTLWIRRS